MYHLVNDASMILWHRNATPRAPPPFDAPFNDAPFNDAPFNDAPSGPHSTARTPSHQGGPSFRRRGNGVALPRPTLAPTLLFYGTGLGGALPWARK